MYCQKCGTRLPEGSAACPACGSSPGAGLALARPVVGVPNYLVQSILVTLFCCMPFGVVAIVFAAMAMSSASAGDRAGAVRAAEQARTWCLVALGLGLVPWVVGLLWVAFAGLAAAAGVAHG
jgi:hypothetical protein